LNTEHSDTHFFPPLLGCHILKKEVSCLIEKFKWPLSVHFLSSSLHIDFDSLKKSLNNSLIDHNPEKPVILYGSCYPGIDKDLKRHGCIRVKGQNCIEHLMGQEDFLKELTQGAFFLLEEWACHWDQTTMKGFGKNEKVMREIMLSEHKYLLALKTPCSENFQKDAEEVQKLTGLPLKWKKIGLTHLETIIRESYQKAGYPLP